MDRSGPGIGIKILVVAIAGIVVQDILLIAMSYSGVPVTIVQIVLGVVLVLALVVGAMWGNAVARALRQLARACYVARKGDTNVLTQMPRADEIGQVNDEINRLVVLLRDLLEAESELGRERRRHERRCPGGAGPPPDIPGHPRVAQGAPRGGGRGRPDPEARGGQGGSGEAALRTGGTAARRTRRRRRDRFEAQVARGAVARGRVPRGSGDRRGRAPGDRRSGARASGERHARRGPHDGRGRRAGDPTSGAATGRRGGGLAGRSRACGRPRPRRGTAAGSRS